ncbi:LysM peptidoglycan-binding domain-containing protein [Paenibacillus sedimenti]|uniref:LysM peptidoglycan-binding domain-containing protein n=1 Tax=Paenibacillus sedimenti TaxID=2770274 RepID=A0A926KPL1_9BACL|nr:LysM peptidoglycan-binding domain-containing protein [Paenibacillus sedimenti]MBD0381677.1 LysM peptidoglycan-binding domain-containing protein [Paenibacillus sedimenti]
MAEQQPGLRFDIYERVHLQEGLAGIQELNDVELLPHIQVITLDDQAILKGNLLLTGNYSSDEGEEPRSLEHLIPVEITLPLNRIHRVEDISVEIENFDIDLLSARSLNVTGVLSLQGVEMVSAPLESWRGEEEITFLHEAEFPKEESAPPVDHGAHEPAVSTFEEQIHQMPQIPQMPVYSAPAAPAPAPVVVPAPIPVPEPSVQPMTPVQEQPAADVDTFTAEVEQTELKVTPHPDSTVVTEDKKELKVAFGKKANEAVEINPYGIKSLLSKASSLLHDKKREEAEAQAQLAEETKIDAVEWKRLFLHSSSNSQEFRKLKMCIVQKEETLDSIAKRYQINPREIQLLNRLSDQEVTAGQVIYLP